MPACALPAPAAPVSAGPVVAPPPPATRLACWVCTCLLLAVAAWGSAAAAATSFDSALRSADARELSQWGRRFEHGEGVDRDIDHAIRLYCKAAARGDATAHYHLGWIYAVGRAGERDDTLAAAWFYRAAQKNDPHAKRMLERLGHKGKPSRQAVCLLSDGSRANADGGIVGSRRYAGRGGTRQVSITRPHPAKGRVAQMVRQLAPEYRLNPNLVLAVIEAESNFNPHARSPKNAQGLMQLIPATAERFGVRDVWDEEENVRGGMAYLRWLMRYFDGDIELVLAAYNAGEGAVERHGGIPPYAETQSYVKRIIGRLN
jgi:soluble lytic murein transglycosylase-like protein